MTLVPVRLTHDWCLRCLNWPAAVLPAGNSAAALTSDIAEAVSTGDDASSEIEMVLEADEEKLDVHVDPTEAAPSRDGAAGATGLRATAKPKRTSTGSGSGALASVAEAPFVDVFPVQATHRVGPGDMLFLSCSQSEFMSFYGFHMAKVILVTTMLRCNSACCCCDRGL